MTTMTAPRYDNRTSAHWRDNLAGKRPPIHESDPHPGFYKCRLSDKSFVAAFIRWQDGTMVCRVGNTMRDPVEQWTWLAKNPIAQRDAEHWFSTGHWPGVEAKPETADGAAATAIPNRDSPPPPIGHNQPPEETLIDRWQRILDGARDWCREIGNRVATDAQDEVAAVKIDALLTSNRDLRAEHKAKTATLVAQKKALDDLYLRKIDKNDEALKHVRALSGAFKDAKQARIDAEARRAEEERAKVEVERARIAKAAEAAGEAPPSESELPPLPEIPEAKVQSGGFTGRKHGLTYDAQLEIADRAKLMRKYGSDDLVTGRRRARFRPAARKRERRRLREARSYRNEDGNENAHPQARRGRQGLARHRTRIYAGGRCLGLAGRVERRSSCRRVRR